MRKVLVAEDDDDLRDMLVTYLKSEGYEPLACENGAVGWTRLRAEGADLAVLDINMPEMNGLELCQRMRIDRRFHGMPVLMLTVKNELPDQVEGYETGADDYLGKPFDLPVLLARLKALERRTLGVAS